MERAGASCDGEVGAGQLERLKDLADELESRLAGADDKSLPGIARQYRETLRDIREIEGEVDDVDEVDEIVERRRPGGQ